MPVKCSTSPRHELLLQTTLGVSLEASFERMREVKAERRRVLTAHCTPEQMARTVKRTPNVFQLLRTTVRNWQLRLD